MKKRSYLICNILLLAAFCYTITREQSPYEEQKTAPDESYNLIEHNLPMINSADEEENEDDSLSEEESLSDEEIKQILEEFNQNPPDDQDLADQELYNQLAEDIEYSDMLEDENENEEEEEEIENNSSREEYLNEQEEPYPFEQELPPVILPRSSSR